MSNSRRVFLLGLDGVPYTLLKEYLARGLLPHFAQLAGKSALCQMDSTLPEISNVSWSSFMTGKDPGGHGVFGFVDLRPGTLRAYYPAFRDLRTAPFWLELGRRGCRAIVLNLPGTYPAAPMPRNGILISGFVAPDLRKAVCPPALLPALESAGYVIDVDTAQAATNRLGLLVDLQRSLEIRARFALDLARREEWDFFMLTVTETDRLQHFFMPAALDENHAEHGAFVDFYRRIDALIGELLDRLDQDTIFMTMSDHGFTALKYEVSLNPWLRAEGYLSTTQTPAEDLSAIAPEALAFAIDPSRIYIHKKGRFPAGRIAPGEEARRLAAEIAAKLVRLTCPHTGEPVVERVWRNDEIYHGPYAAQGPDLVVQSKWGYDLKAGLRRPEIFSRGQFSGMHTRDDAHVLLPEPHGLPARPAVWDVAKEILRHFAAAEVRR